VAGISAAGRLSIVTGSVIGVSAGAVSGIVASVGATSVMMVSGGA